ncbi:MAG: ribosome-associated translation inhibitor RaiA [Bacilli bacterium]|nr:ribosome-associated translation inhibitor RaiA [Bacilli bacterium]
MQITIRGDKIAVTGAIKDYVTEKLVKLDKYFEQPEDIKANAVIKVKNRLQTIEVTVPTSRFTLRAEVSHEDLYAAVDLVIDVLERQIRKNKTRLNNRFKDTPAVDFNLNYEIEASEEDTNKIVKRKDIEMKPMDEEEALLQLNLLDHDFFVFKNIDEECVSVIYKRKDDNFGIINVK